MKRFIGMISIALQLVATARAGECIQKEIIAGIAAHFETSYVFPEIGSRVRSELQRRASAYEGKHGKELAELMTRDLREITKDQHVSVHYSTTPLPQMDEAETRPAPDPSAIARQRANLARVNYGFLKTERLPANIGLLDLDFFADPELAGDVAASAMSFLANCDALIVDLRYNGGGNGRMVAFLATYLFEGDPVQLSDLVVPGMNLVKQGWTLPYVPGRRFGASKPVYILTSDKTFSAAEAFAYDLQAQKRAVIVGETTRGGAHAIGRFRLTEHFGVAVPVTRAVNPLTRSNWEGTGVKPDVEVESEDALRVAQIRILDEWIREGAPDLEEERQKRREALLGIEDVSPATPPVKK